MEKIPHPIRKYPIGIQNIEDVRRQGYLYVDKTASCFMNVIKTAYEQTRQQIQILSDVRRIIIIRRGSVLTRMTRISRIRKYVFLF